MYEQQRLKECEYILKDSGAKLLLVSKETIYDKVSHTREGASQKRLGIDYMPVLLGGLLTTPEPVV